MVHCQNAVGGRSNRPKVHKIFKLGWLAQAIYLVPNTCIPMTAVKPLEGVIISIWDVRASRNFTEETFSV